MMRRGVFGGTFNPFTAGHADIVRRALGIFDEVVICLGINAVKERGGAVPFGDASARRDAIAKYYASDGRVKVVVTSGLMTEAALEMGATALIRAVRSVKDYEYERDMAAVNRLVSGLDTVIFPADPALEAVSSSVVRELHSYGRDISRFLPPGFETEQSGPSAC